jgi:hypothetical protein
LLILVGAVAEHQIAVFGGGDFNTADTSLKKGSQISGTITRIVRDSLRFILRPSDCGK